MSGGTQRSGACVPEPLPPAHDHDPSAHSLLHPFLPVPLLLPPEIFCLGSDPLHSDDPAGVAVLSDIICW